MDKPLAIGHLGQGMLRNPQTYLCDITGVDIWHTVEVNVVYVPGTIVAMLDNREPVKRVAACFEWFEDRRSDLVCIDISITFVKCK
jgi:hypothetical protein